MLSNESQTEIIPAAFATLANPPGPPASRIYHSILHLSECLTLLNIDSIPLFTVLLLL